MHDSLEASILWFDIPVWEWVNSLDESSGFRAPQALQGKWKLHIQECSWPGSRCYEKVAAILFGVNFVPHFTA